MCQIFQQKREGEKHFFFQNKELKIICWTLFIRSQNKTISAITNVHYVEFTKDIVSFSSWSKASSPQYCQYFDINNIAHHTHSDVTGHNFL